MTSLPSMIDGQSLTGPINPTWVLGYVTEPISRCPKLTVKESEKPKKNISDIFERHFFKIQLQYPDSFVQTVPDRFLV